MTKLNDPKLNDMCKKLNKGRKRFGKFPKSSPIKKGNNE